jgi:hypothetical protein
MGVAIKNINEEAVQDLLKINKKAKRVAYTSSALAGASGAALVAIFPPLLTGVDTVATVGEAAVAGGALMMWPTIILSPSATVLLKKVSKNKNSEFKVIPILEIQSTVQNLISTLAARHNDLAEYSKNDQAQYPYRWFQIGWSDVNYVEALIKERESDNKLWDEELPLLEKLHQNLAHICN